MSLSRAVIPQMKSRKWGRIIHISSIMGFVSKAGRGAYSATKSGLIGLARAMSLELGQHGITVNCIAPGPFLTDLPMSVLSKAEQDAFAEKTAMGRWGQPRELAGPALFLASEAGSYVTGTVITVDGGSLAKF
jgi:NAD(P)-dependent dehydrogenase (short-subunit alcohol dehydrogenase family)